MTRMERRSHERVRVRFPCELELHGRRAAGTVRDLSAGGLCVQTSLAPEEGDELALRLHPKGHASVEVTVLVWNVHGVRDRRSGERSTRLGLVLSDATDAFLELLPGRAPASPPRQTAPWRSEPRAGADPPPESTRRAPQRAYRVRVRQSASSRTCTLVVFAGSEEDARAAALAEAGDGWAVLGVTRQHA